MFITALYESGLVIRYKSPRKVRVKDLDIISCGEYKIDKDYSNDNSLQKYFEDLETENYGLMLCDGGLVQISYSLRSRNIVSHRYCYIPSPIFDNVVTEPEVYSNKILESRENNRNILLRSRIRFDYEKDGEFEAHPESHLTLISPDCRIALRGGLDVRRFFRFIFLNFIDASLVTKHQSIFKNESYDLGTLSEQWASELHLNWRSPSL